MRRESVGIGLIAAVILIIAFNMSAEFSARTRAAIREVLAPLQATLTGMARRMGNAVQALRGFSDVMEENRRLSSEIVYLRGLVRELKALETENALLRKQLDFLQRGDRRLLPCEIISRDVTGWWNTVRINRGIADGVKVGVAVITTEGLAGRVVDASLRVADVLLISDPSSRVSVRLPRTGAFGVLSGAGVTLTGRVICRLDYLNKDLPIAAGDEVVTSGLGGMFPPGLLVGYVEEVHRDTSGLYQSATVVPKADLGTLSYVFAVLEEEAEIREYLRGRERQTEAVP